MKITSVNNDFVKKLVKLSKKKYRDEASQLLVEGEHLYEEVLKAGLKHQTIGLDSTYDIEINEAIAEKISQTKSGSSNFTLVTKPEYQLDVSGGRYLLCDGIQDPGNLGTIIRTAHSFGFDAIIVSDDTVDEYNDKVIRSTQGSIFHIPVIRMNLIEAIASLSENGVATYATYLGDDTIGLSDIQDERLAFVLGSEGSGIKESTKNACKQSVKIETSNFESLNVAIAAAIISYTFRSK